MKVLMIIAAFALLLPAANGAQKKEQPTPGQGPTQGPAPLAQKKERPAPGQGGLVQQYSFLRGLVFIAPSK